jgi:hypothetical protein
MRPRRVVRSSSIAAVVVVLTSIFAVSALAGGSSARPATRAERAAIMRSFAANDGNSSAVSGVYVSRSNSSLAVVCERTPEAGARAYVFDRTHGSWHYLAGGSPGHAGNSADQRLERACP